MCNNRQRSGWQFAAYPQLILNNYVIPGLVWNPISPSEGRGITGQARNYGIYYVSMNSIHVSY